MGHSAALLDSGFAGMTVNTPKKRAILWIARLRQRQHEQDAGLLRDQVIGGDHAKLGSDGGLLLAQRPNRGEPNLFPDRNLDESGPTYVLPGVPVDLCGQRVGKRYGSSFELEL